MSGPTLARNRAPNFEELVALVRSKRTAPAGLLFWLEHLAPVSSDSPMCSVVTLHWAWHCMPRAEWLLWCARELGVGAGPLRTARAAADRIEDDARARVLRKRGRDCMPMVAMDAAAAVRAVVTYELLLIAMRRRALERGASLAVELDTETQVAS